MEAGILLGAFARILHKLPKLGAEPFKASENVDSYIIRIEFINLFIKIFDEQREKRIDLLLGAEPVFGRKRIDGQGFEAYAF